MERSKISTKRNVYSNTHLPQETRKIANKPPKRIRKRTNKYTHTHTHKTLEGKKSKIRAEINRLKFFFFFEKKKKSVKLKSFVP